MFNLTNCEDFLRFKFFNIVSFSGLSQEWLLVTYPLNRQHDQVFMWFMSWQPEVPTYWLDSVTLARLGSTTKVGSKPVSEGAVVTIPTLPNISRRHLATLPSVLLAEEQVHPFVLAVDGGGDVHCLACHRAGVGGYHRRIHMLTK